MISKSPKLAVGLMSGTSLDGIDAALVEIHNHGKKTSVRLRAFESIAFSVKETEEILALCHPSTSTVDKICKANITLGEKFAEAAKVVTKNAGLTMQEVDFVSSHGQTIFHMPEQSATLQIGELAVIAEKTGCITIGDYRPSDMAAGGQGAPLVPYVDDLLFRDEKTGRILVNIGGISNLTVLAAGDATWDVMAMDTGPGNVLIDAFVRIGTNGEQKYDDAGKLAQAGKVDEDWLEEIFKADSYMKQGLPKTTGRELYTWELAKRLWEAGSERNLSFEDKVATITAFTVKAIAYHIQTFVDTAYATEEVIVAGGGVHNSAILEGLDAVLSQKVIRMEDVGFSSDAKEAITFAILGNEFLHGSANNLPSATGAEKPVVMGKLVLP
ncbi:anhydro-N-acetylmuramic acid kinase [Thalassobacillus devorans]|uniref:anhydro-N-acetylmuramic acid kinase n=1 Tax=Thalassobacillus devorans TaxID=279813 RepID=UPI0004ADDDDC|nr:anhydro-N-acetylmuramic acid kinase [Thalassobacillus devorans]